MRLCSGTAREYDFNRTMVHNNLSVCAVTVDKAARKVTPGLPHRGSPKKISRHYIYMRGMHESILLLTEANGTSVVPGTVYKPT